MIRAMRSEERRDWVVAQARTAGFGLCGVAPTVQFPELRRMEEWHERGFAGEMRYLRDARRLAPSSALEAARSIIVCALDYNTPFPYSTEAAAITPEDGAPRGWISRYAWGDDYHAVLGGKLEQLLEGMQAEFSEPFAARAYVDTGPVQERVAAKWAGLGWLGKNTCLIHEQRGSWFFLGVIVTTLELAPSLAPGEPPAADLCGQCRLCIDACPTEAIVEPYVLDARRCISYLTIELRGAIPEELRPAMGRMVLGCDICQDVCPWNRRAEMSALEEFQPREVPSETCGDAEPAERTIDSSRNGAGEWGESLLAPRLEWLAELDDAGFRNVFRGSAVKRAKWRGLVRNACVALGNAPLKPGSEVHARVLGLLNRLAASSDQIIAEHAQWALDRQREPGGAR
jgi:epoxyqueuosine reductase